MPRAFVHGLEQCPTFVGVQILDLDCPSDGGDFAIGQDGQAADEDRSVGFGQQAQAHAALLVDLPRKAGGAGIEAMPPALASRKGAVKSIELLARE